MVRVPLGGRIVSLLVGVAALAGTLALGAQAAQRQDRAQVVLITEGCNKSSINCAAFQRAMRRSGVTAKIIAPDVREDPVGTLSLLAKQGYALIIVDINLADALAEVAPKFPQATALRLLLAHHQRQQLLRQTARFLLARARGRLGDGVAR